MINNDTISIAAVVIGGGLVLGTTLAIIGKEITVNNNDTIVDKAESSLIRIGYVSEGVVKGAMISAPVSILALLAVNYGLKAQKKIVGGI